MILKINITFYNYLCILVVLLRVKINYCVPFETLVSIQIMRKFIFALTTLITVLSSHICSGQVTARYIFKNTSKVNKKSYSDDQIYLWTQLGMPGKNGYFNLATNQWEDINSAPTMIGPDGNTYTNANLKLSNLPKNANGQYYLDLPASSVGRIYIGFGGPIYANGANNPTLDAPSNPNYYTKVETIELNNASQIFTNTSRVDRYVYPMGEELYCTNAGGKFYDKVGETVSHEQVIAKWKLFVNEDFQNSYDPVRDVITQMGHTPYFQVGKPGHDYFDKFIDDWFAYHRTNTLRAEWNGTIKTANVVGDIMTWNDGTTFNRSDFKLEDFTGGSGPFVNNLGQILGVTLTRGAIQITSEIQEWDNPANFYTNPVKNDYAHFFHSDFVSYLSKTYALAYDDVFDQSSTQSCQGTVDSVVVSLGGFGTLHTQNLANVYIDPQAPKVDQYKTFQLTAKGLDQGSIDMEIPAGAVISWTATNPSGANANTLISNSGVFGPADVEGDYTINLTVTVAGIIYTATTTISVLKAGSTGQICTGLISTGANAEYKLEVIGQRVYLTLVPLPSWQTPTGSTQLFYGANSASNMMGSNLLIPNQPFYLDNFFFGDEVYFYISSNINGSTPNDSPIKIEKLGTCEGLEIQEEIVQIETEPTVTINQNEGHQIAIVGITNKGNRVNFPNPLFNKTIQFSGVGVNASGLFTSSVNGEFPIDITYNGLLTKTLVKVKPVLICTSVIAMGATKELCNQKSEIISMPLGYTNMIWSGTGASFLSSTNTQSTTFNATTPGEFKLEISATDASSCIATGTLSIIVKNTTPTPLALSKTEVNTTITDQATVPNVCATGTEIKWYSNPSLPASSVANSSCHTPIFKDIAPTDNKMDVGEYTFYATQTLDGCESTPIEVKITVSECSTNAPISSDTNICLNSSLPTLTTQDLGENFEWTSSDRTTILSRSRTLDLRNFQSIYSSAGSYNFYVSKKENDANGNLCRGPQKKVVVKVNEIPNFILEPLAPVCKNALVTLKPKFVSQNLTFNWLNTLTNEIIKTDIDSLEILPLTTKTFTAVAINEFNCSANKEITISVVELPRSEIISTDFTLCKNESTKLVAFDDINQNYSFEWLYSTSKTIPFTTISTNKSQDFDKEGLYTLRVKNKNICAKTSDTVKLTIENIDLAIKISADTLKENETVELLALSNTNNPTFIWTTPKSKESTASIKYLMEENTTFFVEVKGKKCILRDTVKVVVKNPFRIPNGFSPNGDDKNDTWKITGLPDEELTISIYNRWGALVYDFLYNDSASWTGVNKNGEPLPIATYYYVITSKKAGGLKLSGNVTILR